VTDEEVQAVNLGIKPYVMGYYGFILFLFSPHFRGGMTALWQATHRRFQAMIAMTSKSLEKVLKQ